MTLQTEIRRFSRKYKLKLAEARDMFAKYGRKPSGYRPVLGISSDAKTVKGQETRLPDWHRLSCARQSLRLRSLLHFRSQGCTDACLGNEGRAAVYKSVTLARIRKTHRYFQQRKAFLASLRHDCFRLMRMAAKRGLVPCVRPNGTSDLLAMAYEAVKTFPMLQFYDYTKNLNPWLRKRANYHITFSRSGTNDDMCQLALRHGINVSVVFAKGTPLPAAMWGTKVIDGDKHDLRFLDPQGVVVGLTSKGKSASKDTSKQFIIL